MSGIELRKAPFGYPTPGIIWRRTQKRKYAFATFVNWINRFFGRKFRQVYFVVVTRLSQNFRSCWAFSNIWLISKRRRSFGPTFLPPSDSYSLCSDGVPISAVFVSTLVAGVIWFLGTTTVVRISNTSGPLKLCLAPFGAILCLFDCCVRSTPSDWTSWSTLPTTWC